MQVPFFLGPSTLTGEWSPAFPDQNSGSPLGRGRGFSREVFRAATIPPHRPNIGTNPQLPGPRPAAHHGSPGPRFPSATLGGRARGGSRAQRSWGSRVAGDDSQRAGGHSPCRARKSRPESIPDGRHGAVETEGTAGEQGGWADRAPPPARPRPATPPGQRGERRAGAGRRAWGRALPEIATSCCFPGCRHPRARALPLLGASRSRPARGRPAGFGARRERMWRHLEQRTDRVTSDAPQAAAKGRWASAFPSAKWGPGTV